MLQIFLRNNLVSLICYFVIGITVQLLTGYSLGIFGFHLNVRGLFFSIPILIATPALFILAGRYILKSHGSSFVDLLSVALVCILGLLCTPSIAFYKPHYPGNLCVASLYFLYIAPLEVTVETYAPTWDSLGISQGLSGLFSGGFFSVVPSVLMWIGLRLQSRKHLVKG